ncbi:hypothetical protein AYI68_g5608 [Smittium mucronatum]|uniref:Uncharacterized protein n=1 Tax=Smittium mucronatum TaxID=133383 RepID=A0A1R0GTX7_9FUNG|nr:hypothetical protein AYI68_g5608 [Smittium mucronatum]
MARIKEQSLFKKREEIKLAARLNKSMIKKFCEGFENRKSDDPIFSVALRKTRLWKRTASSEPNFSESENFD